MPGLVYEANTPQGFVWYISGLLLHITMNPSSTIVIEERNFISIQLQIQYQLVLWRLKFKFINHMHQYSSITWPLQWINFCYRGTYNFFLYTKGVQYHFAKFELIYHMRVREQNSWQLSTWNNLERGTMFKSSYTV